MIKNICIIGLFILLLGCQTAKIAPPEKRSFSYVFKVDKTRKQIHNKAHEWILLNASSAAILGNKPESGLLIARGSLMFQYYAIRLPTRCTFRIIIRSHDGRMELSFTNLTAHWEVMQGRYNPQPVRLEYSLKLIGPQIRRIAGRLRSYLQ